MMQVEEHNTDRVGHILDFFHQLWSLQKHKHFSLAKFIQYQLWALNKHLTSMSGFKLEKRPIFSSKFGFS